MSYSSQVPQLANQVDAAIVRLPLLLVQLMASLVRIPLLAAQLAVGLLAMPLIAVQLLAEVIEQFPARVEDYARERIAEGRERAKGFDRQQGQVLDQRMAAEQDEPPEPRLRARSEEGRWEAFAAQSATHGPRTAA